VLLPRFAKSDPRNHTKKASKNFRVRVFSWVVLSQHLKNTNAVRLLFLTEHLADMDVCAVKKITRANPATAFHLKV